VAPEVRGEAGVGVLRDVARLVRATARHSDAVGRVGLTEFAVIAPGANRIGARRLAQRLQGAAHASGNGGGTGEVAVGLRAGYDALRQLRTAAIEPRRLLGRAARALEMARAEGKWLREGATARAPLASVRRPGLGRSRPRGPQRRGDAPAGGARYLRDEAARYPQERPQVVAREPRSLFHAGERGQPAPRRKRAGTHLGQARLQVLILDQPLPSFAHPR